MPAVLEIETITRLEASLIIKKFKSLKALLSFV